MHNWHPLNENGLAQIERTEESTKHKRVNIWTTAWQNQQNDMCAQRRLRSAWAFVQSDQSLLCAHEESLGP